MAGQHGGARPRSGRKSKPRINKESVDVVNEAIRERIPDLVANALKLAEGVPVQKVTPDGEPCVYKTVPNIKAIVYLLNRLIGEPVKAVTLKGDKDAPVVVKVLRGITMEELDPS
jgi:hypothetical protein